MIWGRSERKLPLLGVRGSGKTYFLVSLGHYVTHKGWGRIADEGADRYLQELTPYVLRGESIPPTRGNYPVEIELDTVDSLGFDGPVELNPNLTISTVDFSGGQFEAAVEEATVAGGFETGPANEFRELYADADGLVVVVDLVRGADPVTFESEREDRIRAAIGEQVVPLAKCLEIALEQHDLGGKPIYIVFTKGDIHGLEGYEIDDFGRAMSIVLGRLERHGCEIETHSVSAVGWADDDGSAAPDVLDSKGFDRFVESLARRFG